MAIKDYKWAKIVIYLSCDALLFLTLILGQIAILWKSSRRLLENCTRSQKNKTSCILGIYGSKINDFQAQPHAFLSS